MFQNRCHEKKNNSYVIIMMSLLIFFSVYECRIEYLLTEFLFYIHTLYIVYICLMFKNNKYTKKK